jgi:hypothetical protein
LPQSSATAQTPTVPTALAPQPTTKPPAEKPAIDVFAAAKQRAKRRNQ